MLEGANVKRSRTVSDINGKSARSILEYLLTEKTIDGAKYDEIYNQKIIAHNLKATKEQIVDDHNILKDRSLLDCLFQSVNSMISRMFYKLNKSKNFTPSFIIMVLHTFGRDLKWNSHIHCLISKDGYSDDGFWRPVKYFDCTYLRNAFLTALLNEMESIIGSSLKK